MKSIPFILILCLTGLASGADTGLSLEDRLQNVEILLLNSKVEVDQVKKTNEQLKSSLTDLNNQIEQLKIENELYKQKLEGYEKEQKEDKNRIGKLEERSDDQANRLDYILSQVVDLSINITDLGDCCSGVYPTVPQTPTSLTTTTTAAPATTTTTVTTEQPDIPDTITINAHTGNVQTLLATSSGSYLISVSTTDKRVNIWSESGNLVHTISLTNGDYHSIALTNAEDELVVVGLNGQVNFYRMSSFELSRSFQVKGRINSLIFNPSKDEQLIAGGDNQIIIIDVDKQSTTKTITGGITNVNNLAFDQSLTLFSSSMFTTTISKWDIQKGTLAGKLQGHVGGINHLIFDKTMQYLVSCGFDKTVKLWNTQKMSLVKSMTGHTNSVLSVASGSNGQLFSGSYDNTIKIWDLGKAQLIKSIDVDISANRMLVTSKDKLVAGAIQGKIKIQSISNLL